MIWLFHAIPEIKRITYRFCNDTLVRNVGLSSKDSQLLLAIELMLNRRESNGFHRKFLMELFCRVSGVGLPTVQRVMSSGIFIALTY